MNAADRAEEFRRRLDAAADATEAALDALLLPAALPGEITRPARLLEAMRYATLGGGKRLRAVKLKNSDEPDFTFKP